MPTLFRILATLGLLLALVLGGMVALATLVTPRQSEMTVPIPPEKLKPQPVQP
jgi:hypothetical protein